MGFWNIAIVFISIIYYYYFKCLPYGFAVPWKERTKYAEIDFSNDLLLEKHGRLQKIYERLEDENDEPLMKGPETIVINNNNDDETTIYILTEDGNLVGLTDIRKEEEKQQDGSSRRNTSILTAKTTKIANLGMGRPLGGTFTTTTTTTTMTSSSRSTTTTPPKTTIDVLYIADAILGLLRIQDPKNYPKSKVELLANEVYDPNLGQWTKLQYVNDVVVGPKTGMVYFTDSCTIAPNRSGPGDPSWDTLHASKINLMRGDRSGRVLRYDPTTGNVTILARDLWFANGISIDEDETYLVVAETFAMRLLKIPLLVTEDAKQQPTTILVDSHELTGYLDGTDCHWKSKDNNNNNNNNNIAAAAAAGTSSSSPPQYYCYAAIPSAVVPLVKLLLHIPHPMNQWLRSLVMSSPKSLLPKVKTYGGIIQVDPERNQLIQILQDPLGTDIGMITGVTVHDGKLYLGSLTNNFIGVYNLHNNN